MRPGQYILCLLVMLLSCLSGKGQSIPGLTVKGLPNDQADSLRKGQDKLDNQMKHFRSELDSSLNKPKASQKLRPEFHGYARVYGQYANANYPFQPGPSSYIGYELVPQLKWGNIAFDIPVQYSTQQRSVGYQLNRISFRFDRQAFVRGMQQKARERLLKENRWKDSLRYRMEQQMRDLPGTRGLKDSIAQRIQGLRDSIPNDSLTIDTTEITRLRQQYDSIQRCVARMEEVWEQYGKLREMKFFDPSEMISQYKPGLNIPKDRMTRAERIFATVQQFQAGTINPVYNTLYLQGVSMSGVNLELQAGPYYMAGIAGRVSQPLTFNALRPELEHRWLYGARAGLGSREGTHIHFSYLSSNDQHMENRSTGEPGVDIFNPQQNKVATADVRVNLNARWWLSSEYGISASNEAPVSQDSVSGETPAQPANRFSLDNNMFHAWRTGITGELKNARLQAGVQRTGSYYYTVGNPYLRRDLLRYEVRWQQKLYKNIVRWDAQGQLDRDNLDNRKAYTSHYQYLTNSVDIRMKRWPTFRVMHAYRTQQSQAVTERYRNTVNLYAVTGTYQKRFKLYHQLSWMMGYNYQRQRDDAGSVTATNYLIVGQTYYYKDWLDVQYSGTVIFSGTADTLTQADGRQGTMNAHQLAGHIRYGKGWSSGAGGNYTHDPIWGRISGVYIQQQAPLWKNAAFDIQAGLNHYSRRDDGLPPQQWTLNAQLTQRW